MKDETSEQECVWQEYDEETVSVTLVVVGSSYIQDTYCYMVLHTPHNLYPL